MPTPEDRRRKVAILGGGAAGLAAAHELTRTRELREAFEVTVHQHGWRLGGKGASGRNRADHDRIEEHGLHIWFGFYENAFGLLGHCYDELRRQGRSKRFPTCADAFLPCARLGLAEEAAGGWRTHSFPLPSAPGGNGLLRWFPAYLLRLLAGVAEDLLGLEPGQAPDSEIGLAYGALLDAAARAEAVAAEAPTPQRGMGLGERLAGLLGRGVGKDGLLAVAEEARVAEDAFATAAAGSRDAAGTLLLISRLAGFAKSVIAILAVRVIPRVGRDPAPFDHLNALELRDALRGARRDGSPLDCPRRLRNHLRRLRRLRLLADEGVLEAPFVRVLYDLAFAYRDGDPGVPDVAAGVGLENLVNISFRHSGVLMHKMRAGMGDIVFAPLYRLLGERGGEGDAPRVRFEFFSAVERLDAPGGRVERIAVRRQAGLAEPEAPYRPLHDVNGLPCWPSAPLAEQLDGPSRIAVEGLHGEDGGDHPALAFEREVDPLGRGETDSLLDGEDFDDVVLAIPVGAHAEIAGPLGDGDQGGIRDAAFRQMAAAPTVATNACQVWLTETSAALGLLDGAAEGETTVLGNYRKPFDTYCDMTHLLAEESWPTARWLCGRRAPRSVAYFCGPMHEPPGDWREADREAGRRALGFLRAHQAEGEGRPFWQSSFGPELLFASRRLKGWDRLRAQYWRANSTGWERYAASHAGTMERRLRPDGRRPDGSAGMRVENLVLAGDWTHTAVNAGSVEAAVASGIEAARALIRRANARDGSRLPEPRIALPSWRRDS